ncbi:NUDIX domain-containing protein [Candidatus Woesearchaeota archaeon]|nr:NUDIX domain-containing protein [Candidatus Woesearchaeota archaeon]
MKTHVITTAVVKYGELYLIAKRALTKKFAPGKWEFISGFIDTPETAEEVILRELREETALTGRIVRSADPFVLTDEEGRWVVIPYLMQVTTDRLVLNKKDHSAMRWVRAGELCSYEDLTELSELRKRQLL